MDELNKIYKEIQNKLDNTFLGRHHILSAIIFLVLLIIILQIFLSIVWFIVKFILSIFAFTIDVIKFGIVILVIILIVGFLLSLRKK